MTTLSNMIMSFDKFIDIFGHMP